MPESLARDTSSSEDLIVAVGTAGDRTAFARLFAHFAPRIKAYLMRTGSDAPSADELTQEVMLLVWRKAARFDPLQANAATWIFAIARNKRIDAYRRDRRFEFDPEDPVLLPEPEPPTDRRLEAAERAARLGEAIRLLPEEQSAVLQLAFYEGKSHSAIAEEARLPLGTVKSRLRLALARLRARLEGED
jgi:RNA polymerase sigma-70 factor (ECF subfamily)